MSVVHQSHQTLYLPPAVSLPREHLAAIQHILNDALRGTPAPHPPPPYNPCNANQQWYKPRMDMFEASGAVTTKFELPGLRKEDIHIDIVEGRMIVVGERSDRSCLSSSKASEHDEEISDAVPSERASLDGDIPADEASSEYKVREIKRGRFKRVVALPAGTKLEDIKAAMHDGILTVTFPGAPRPVVRSVPIN